jgi:hypothetical protein
MSHKPTVRIELNTLRKLAEQVAEYHRINMTYGGEIVKVKTPWYRIDKEVVPFTNWEDSWKNLLNYYPYSDLKGLFNSKHIEGYFVPPVEVEISLHVAGVLGYVAGESNVK